MKTILYVGCPAADKPDVEKELSRGGIAVVWADSAATAAHEVQRRELPVLLDLSRGAASLQAIKEIRTARGSALIFAVVDPRRPDMTTEAVLAGVADVFARFPAGHRVVAAIERETGKGARPTKNGGLDLYGHSPAMREVLTYLARAASMRAGVLIRGEAGSGRQAAARAIHASQPNPDAAFVVVNCAAYEAGELETVLFGGPGVRPAKHEEADARGLERISRSSLLYEARGGTLYIQNVADSPARVQARLARVLRDREATVADRGELVDVDVRPVAGVDPSIDEAVQDGRVREDLYRRLAVIRVDMPPLRSRREDIPVLANYFLREICAIQGLPPKTLSRPALALLGALPWRGNAAELRTVLQSIVSGQQGGRNIALEDVLAHVRLDGGAMVASTAGTLKQARAKFEREYIAAVLEQNRGSISEAARVLGIQRTNLYRKLRSLHIKSTGKSRGR